MINYLMEMNYVMCRIVSVLVLYEVRVRVRLEDVPGGLTSCLAFLGEGNTRFQFSSTFHCPHLSNSRQRLNYIPTTDFVQTSGSTSFVGWKRVSLRKGIDLEIDLYFYQPLGGTCDNTLK
jgi:hypothetical protein